MSSRSAHMIKDFYDGRNIAALQRYCGVRAFLRCRHLGGGVWELPGFHVSRRESREEGSPEC